MDVELEKSNIEIIFVLIVLTGVFEFKLEQALRL